MHLLQSLFSWLVKQGRKMWFLRPFLDTILQDKDISELVQWSWIALVFKMISLPLWLATSLIISRLYWADAMGLFGLMTTIMWIAVSIWLWWMWSAMPRFLWEIKAKEEDQKKQHWQIQAVYRTWLVTIIAVSIVLSFVLFFCAELIAVWLFDEGRLILPLQAAAFLLVPYVRYTFNTQFLVAHKKIFHSELITKLIVPSIVLLLLVVLYFVQPLATIPVRVYLGSGVVWLVASLWFMRKEKFVAVRWTLANWKEMVKISSPMWLTGMMSLILSYSDILMLWYYEDESMVWVYSVVLSLGSFMLIAWQIANAVIGPIIWELHFSGDMNKVQNLLRSQVRVISLYCGIIWLLLVICSPILLSFYGHVFVSHWATPFIIIVIMYFICSALGQVSMYCNTIGRQSLLFKVVFVASILNVIINYTLIPQLGIVWAAVWFAVSLISVYLALNIIVYKKDRIILALH